MKIKRCIEAYNRKVDESATTELIDQIRKVRIYKNNVKYIRRY